MAVGLCNLTGKNIILKPNITVAKISAANVVPHNLAHKNPMGTKNQQATVHPSELHNTTEAGTCLDDLEQGRSPTDTPPYENISLSSVKACQIF